MSKRNSWFLNQVTDLDETFKFDSKDSIKVPKNSSMFKNEEPELDLSQRTSEIMREANERNQNILELLEESEEDKRTQKNYAENKNDLWNFFARFEKQSNPDITISQIEFPIKKERKYQKENANNQLKGKNKSKMVEKNNQGDQEFNQGLIQQNQLRQQQMQSSARYPKRNRVHPLKYWLGERCIYKGGKLVDITRNKQSSQQK